MSEEEAIQILLELKDPNNERNQQAIDWAIRAIHAMNVAMEIVWGNHMVVDLGKELQKMQEEKVAFEKELVQFEEAVAELEETIQKRYSTNDSDIDED